MSKNIAIIGDWDFISAFKAVGFSLFSVDEKTDLRALFIKAVESDFLFIFILENYASKIIDLIEQYSQLPRPSIIPLPDWRHDISLSEDLLGDLAIRAIGKDIIKEQR